MDNEDYSDFEWFLRTEFIHSVLESDGFLQYITLRSTEDDIRLRNISDFIALCRATITYLHGSNRDEAFTRMKESVFKSGVLELMQNIMYLEGH